MKIITDCHRMTTLSGKGLTAAKKGAMKRALKSTSMLICQLKSHPTIDRSKPREAQATSVSKAIATLHIIPHPSKRTRSSALAADLSTSHTRRAKKPMVTAPCHPMITSLGNDRNISRNINPRAHLIEQYASHLVSAIKVFLVH